MNGADRGNLEQMQKEAARRAREMQRRATPDPHAPSLPPMPSFVQTPYGGQGQSHLKSPPAPPKPPNPAPPQKGLQLLRMLNFGSLQLQGDTLLLIMLLLLLANEGADIAEALQYRSLDRKYWSR